MFVEDKIILLYVDMYDIYVQYCVFMMYFVFLENVLILLIVSVRVVLLEMEK